MLGFAYLFYMSQLTTFRVLCIWLPPTFVVLVIIFLTIGTRQKNMFCCCFGCICSFYSFWLWKHLQRYRVKYFQRHNLLINLRCSCAYKTCTTSIKVITDKSVFSNKVIFVSYLSLEVFQLRNKKLLI